MLILSWTSRKTNSWLKKESRVHLPSSLSDQMIPSKAADVLKPVGQSSAGMICEKLLGSLVVRKKNCSYSIWVLANANTRWCPIPYLGFIMLYSRHIYDMYICIYINIYIDIYIRMSGLKQIINQLPTGIAITCHYQTSRWIIIFRRKILRLSLKKCAKSAVETLERPSRPAPQRPSGRGALEKKPAGKATIWQNQLGIYGDLMGFMGI